MVRNPVQLVLMDSMQELVVEKSFSSITVQEICERAGVSRRTFYRYYHDKYSLLEEVCDELFISRILESSGASVWDTFKELCNEIYAKKNFFRHAIDITGQNGFWEEMTKRLTPVLKEELPDLPWINESVFDFFSALYVEMLLKFVAEWLKTDLKQSPEEFYTYVRAHVAVYGIWCFEGASNKEYTEFPPNYIDKFTC